MVAAQTNAPYYDALEIISNASRLTQSSKPTKQDALLVSTVKSKWSKIMDRVSVRYAVLCLSSDVYECSYVAVGRAFSDFET